MSRQSVSRQKADSSDDALSMTRHGYVASYVITKIGKRTAVIVNDDMSNPDSLWLSEAA